MITPDTTRGVALISEYLLRRGMRPVIVLLDAASFGGSMGMDELANTLEMMRVPVCRVANGDDLSERLSEQSHPNMWG